MKLKDIVRLVFKSAIYRPFKRYPKVLSPEETIDFIKEKNISIARFGDGELSLMEKRGLSFQKYDSCLSKKLIDVKNSKYCLVCIPDIFSNKSFNKKLIVKEEYRFWTKQKVFLGGLWKKNFPNQTVYGNAFISRFYYRFKDKSQVEKYIENLKALWENKNILLVEGRTSQIGVGNDILDNSKSIRRIVCPSKNAFEYYEEIIESIKSNYNNGDVVLLALGPTATVLSYELSEYSQGKIQLLDLGHFDIEYEWFLAKTDKKIPVKNKHVNECQSMGEINTADKHYMNQIITIIGN